MEIATSIVVGGIVTGLLYVLVALGFNLIFGIMDVINFAHGYFVMWGGYLVYTFVRDAHLPLYVAILATAAACGVGGALLQVSLFRRVVGLPFASMVLTIGLGLILQNVAQIIFGPNPVAISFPISGSVSLFGSSLPNQRIVVALVALAALGLLYVYLMHTNLGRAVRAVAQDREAASLQGIPAGLTYSFAFGIGALLAGLSGALLGPLQSVNLGMGDTPLLKAFVVVVIGGLGSVGGTAVAGILLGILDAASVFVVGPGASDLVGFAAMFLLLLLKPSGLFSRHAERA